jgi:hypothetical protein
MNVIDPEMHPGRRAPRGERNRNIKPRLLEQEQDL